MSVGRSIHTCKPTGSSVEMLHLLRTTPALRASRYRTRTPQCRVEGAATRAGGGAPAIQSASSVISEWQRSAGCIAPLHTYRVLVPSSFRATYHLEGRPPTLARWPCVY